MRPDLPYATYEYLHRPGVEEHGFELADERDVVRALFNKRSWRLMKSVVTLHPVGYHVDSTVLRCNNEILDL